MKRILLGRCEHTTKCTKIPTKGWGCRVFVNGELNQEIVVPRRDMIGPAFREMLRWEDKCGNISEMASNSRKRHKSPIKPLL